VEHELHGKFLWFRENRVKNKVNLRPVSGNFLNRKQKCDRVGEHLMEIVWLNMHCFLFIQFYLHLYFVEFI